MVMWAKHECWGVLTLVITSKLIYQTGQSLTWQLNIIIITILLLPALILLTNAVQSFYNTVFRVHRNGPCYKWTMYIKEQFYKRIIITRNDVYETVCPQPFACQEGFISFQCPNLQRAIT